MTRMLVLSPTFDKRNKSLRTDQGDEGVRAGSAPPPLRLRRCGSPPHDRFAAIGRIGLQILRVGAADGEVPPGA
jgi:hypothetical protein